MGRIWKEVPNPNKPFVPIEEVPDTNTVSPEERLLLLERLEELQEMHQNGRHADGRELTVKEMFAIAEEIERIQEKIGIPSQFDGPDAEGPDSEYEGYEFSEEEMRPLHAKADEGSEAGIEGSGVPENIQTQPREPMSREDTHDSRSRHQGRRKPWKGKDSQDTIRKIS